ncbi:MAG: peptidylprolyl isomerase [Gemmatimonadota bacterium]
MRIRLIHTAAVMMAAPLFAHAQQPAAPSLQPPSASVGVIPLDRIVAGVGDVIITQSALQERIIAKRADGVRLPTDSAEFRKFVRSVVSELQDEELLLLKAKDLKVEVPDADVASTVDKTYKDVRKRFTTESEFKSELAKAGYGTPEEYKRFQADGVKRNETISRTVKKLREDGKIAQSNVTDAEIAESFERTRATLPRREPAVAWRQIIIAPQPSPAAKAVARAKAESLLVELRDGAEFEKIAKRESADSGSKENGGDLGWNRRGKMVPEFDRWMFALPPNQLSPVVETAFGFHIIRVDRIQPAEVKARHILIAPKIDSLDVARARRQADSVGVAWKAGAPFDSLAKKNHDFKSGEETSLLTPFPKAQLPPAYAEAFVGKVPNDIVVFPIQGNGNVSTKFVVAQVAAVDEGGEYTLPEVKERFRARLAEEGGIKRLMDQLRKSTYVFVREDALASLTVPAAGQAP